MTEEDALKIVASNAAAQNLMRFNPKSDKEPAFNQLVNFYLNHWKNHPISYPKREVSIVMKGGELK